MTRMPREKKPEPSDGRMVGRQRPISNVLIMVSSFMQRETARG